MDTDPVLISARLLPSCVNLGMDFTLLSLSFPHLEKGTELSLTYLLLEDLGQVTQLLSLTLPFSQLHIIVLALGKGLNEVE